VTEHCTFNLLRARLRLLGTELQTLKIVSTCWHTARGGHRAGLCPDFLVTSVSTFFHVWLQPLYENLLQEPDTNIYCPSQCYSVLSII